jgi:hypothetical protein
LVAALLAAVLLVLTGGGSAGGTSGPARFELGRIGGNIAPFTVEIRANGTLRSSGAVRLAHPRTRLPNARLVALLREAQGAGFWSLPRRTLCRGSLPDFASLYVTVHTGTRMRRVAVRGDCNARFSRVYRSLSRAATVTTGR